MSLHIEILSAVQKSTLGYTSVTSHRTAFILRGFNQINYLVNLINTCTHKSSSVNNYLTWHLNKYHPAPKRTGACTYSKNRKYIRSHFPILELRKITDSLSALVWYQILSHIYEIYRIVIRMLRLVPLKVFYNRHQHVFILTKPKSPF